MSISDRELLELAAKAVGIPGEYREGHDPAIYGSDECNWGIWKYPSMWNPLENDSDAFHLMLQLQIDISFWREEDSVCVSIYQNSRATAVGAIGAFELRRAIVRAAAEIGRSMP